MVVSSEFFYAYRPLPTVNALPANKTLPDVTKQTFDPASNALLSSALLTNVVQIPTLCLAFAKDAIWMAMVSELFACASNICSLIGNQASTYVPYLTIFSAPVYLAHAIKEAKRRFTMMTSAFKASRLADGFFNLGAGIGALGSALSDIIKPFAGGATLIGLTQIHAVSFIFSFIFPIILIVLSTIGGGAQAWGIFRTAKSLYKFKLARDNLDGSFEKLEIFLNHLQGPQKTDAHYDLKLKNFQENCFTDHERYEVLQERINLLLGFRSDEKIDSVQDTLIDLIVLIRRIVPLFSIEAEQSPLSFLQRIDRQIAICEQLLVIADVWQPSDAAIVQTVQDLKKSHAELLQLKKNLYNEGVDISDKIRGEIERKLAEQCLFMLSATLTLTAGMLFLMLVGNQTIAYAISISSSAVNLISISLNKAVPHTHFSSLQEYLELQKELESKNRLPL